MLYYNANKIILENTKKNYKMPFKQYQNYVYILYNDYIFYF